MPMEGKTNPMKEKNTKKIGSNFIKFKKPRVGVKQVYKFNDVTVSLEVHKTLKIFLKITLTLFLLY